MNLYHMIGTARGYDVYDSCIVAAKNEDEARKIHPSGYDKWEHWDDWTNEPENVKVEFIGVALPHIKSGVVLSSFNAG